jgi:endogenous inhibitor of DNA gyrase (YacG/DUF329 family)
MTDPAPVTKPKRARPPRPSIKERASIRICPECSKSVERRSPKGPLPTFCGPDCKKAFGNRQMVEGRAVIALAKAWRIDRGVGEIATTAFAQMVQILDRYNAEDRDFVGPDGETRARADLYAAKLLGDGSLFVDRMRHRPNAD